ncbi:DEKNAAC104919 [Brettanomyces naardenensis]|uniref:DEKNAAC104919 n=1 Tax=Brettanomyces naardenensis TaxID=13370 RepID=A0A448YS18_BRENA|nr:DEKNAAC104919 [Brettanomyces naardenensis]
MTPTYQFQRPSFPGARNESRSNSVSSASSDVPMNDQHMPSLYPCNSASSLASSIGGAPSPVNLTRYEFSPRFDESLLQMFHSYANQPSITPFNLNFPPSGVCSKISKQMYRVLLDDRSLTIDKSRKKHDELMLDSNRAKCLGVIRRRLLELCNGNADQTIPIMSRNSSALSLSFSQPPQPVAASSAQLGSRRPSWLHQNLSFSAARISSTDSLVDSVQMDNAQQQQQQQQQQQHQQWPPAQTPYYPQDIMTPPPSSYQKVNGSPVLEPSSHLNHGYGLTVFTNPPSAPALGSRPGSASESPTDRFTFENTRPLQSPFHDLAPPLPLCRKPAARSGSLGSANSPLKNVSSLTEMEIENSNPLFNATSQRKRDSLKLKRNMK